MKNPFLSVRSVSSVVYFLFRPLSWRSKTKIQSLKEKIGAFCVLKLQYQPQKTPQYCLPDEGRNSISNSTQYWTFIAKIPPSSGGQVCVKIHLYKNSSCTIVITIRHGSIRIIVQDFFNSKNQRLVYGQNQVS